MQKISTWLIFALTFSSMTLLILNLGCNEEACKTPVKTQAALVTLFFIICFLIHLLILGKQKKPELEAVTESRTLIKRY